MGRGRPPGKMPADEIRIRQLRAKMTPMDRFWEEWGSLVKILGASGFQDFVKQCGGKIVPTYQELLNIGKAELLREKMEHGATLSQIRYIEKLGAGKVEEILKEIEEEGERERREREPDEYGE